MRAFVTFTRHDVDIMTARREEAPNEGAAFGNDLYRMRTTLGAYYVSLLARMKRTAYDKLYVSSLQHSDAASIAAAIGVEAVIHAHGNDVFSSRFADPVTRWARTRGMRKASRFIAVSAWTGDQLARTGIPPDRIKVIPNGVDVAAFRAAAPDAELTGHEHGGPFSLLTVSRLVPRKGHRLVLEALTEVPGVHYVIVGEGPERARLQHIAERLGLASRVTFVGYVPDEALPDIYRRCDAFIMASEHVREAGSVEGFGLSFLEANASGKAVIGTRTGGIASAIRHEYNGLLCEAAVPSVAEAIRRMKDDATLRRTLEHNARAWAEAHDWSVVVGQIDDVLAG